MKPKTKMLCLCATYGRPRLLANSLALFLNQTYEDKFLLIFDDYGQYKNFEGPNYRIVSTDKRSDDMPHKYRRMFEMLNLEEFLGVCIWDDDDIYLPNHIELHAKALQQHFWSRPEYVYTICPKLAIEYVKGNHWASYAFEPKTLMSNMPYTKMAYWDSLLIRNVTKDYEPTIIQEPTFIFRWQTTKHPHLQFYINDPTDTTSYMGFPCADNREVDPLIPMLDEETRTMLTYDFTDIPFKG